jgi:hypothetical protein
MKTPGMASESFGYENTIPSSCAGPAGESPLDATGAFM